MKLRHKYVPNLVFFFEQTQFVTSDLVLTNYRIFWGRPDEVDNQGSRLVLALRYIVFFEEESPSAFSFSRSKKIVLHLSEPAPGKLLKPKVIPF